MLDRKLAEEKLDKICARLETSPRKSLDSESHSDYVYDIGNCTA